MAGRWTRLTTRKASVRWRNVGQRGKQPTGEDGPTRIGGVHGRVWNQGLDARNFTPARRAGKEKSAVLRSNARPCTFSEIPAASPRIRYSDAPSFSWWRRAASTLPGPLLPLSQLTTERPHVSPANQESSPVVLDTHDPLRRHDRDRSGRDRYSRTAASLARHGNSTREAATGAGVSRTAPLPLDGPAERGISQCPATACGT